ncbi:MAG: hypothetical protein AB1772_05155 [Candidatus Zixiibacteriota bacterium]
MSPLLYGQEADTLPRGAVAKRFVAATRSLESFRPVGDLRVWAFYARQTTFGQLTSAITGYREIDDQNALILRESLEIDYAKLDMEGKVALAGECYVTPRGGFAGCEYQIGPRDSAEQLNLKLTIDRLAGYYTRAGTKRDVALPLVPGRFMWDSYLIDQLEIYLAMRDLQIGTRFDDSVFMPQSLMSTHIAGQVIWFMWQEIYKGKIDSVFVIKLTEPGNYQLYFTPDKRLVRVDMLDQNIRVYQDVVRRAPTDRTSQAATPVRPPFSLKLLVLKLPHYVAFLFVAAAAILLLAWRSLRWPEAYLYLAGGAVLFALMPLVFNPMLVYIATEWLDLAQASGSGLYIRGAVLPVITGFVQVGLMLGASLTLQRTLKVRAYRLTGLGAFLGAGFGLAEAVYVAGWQITLLFDWPLLERACLIVLHTASGALLGRFLSDTTVRLGYAFVGALIANAAARFLPLFVQRRVIGLEAVHVILAFWVVAYLVVALVFSKKSEARASQPPAVAGGAAGESQ